MKKSPLTYLSQARFTFSAGFWVLLTLMMGCKAITDMTKVEPFANLTYKLKYQPAKTLVQGVIVDAKTGVPLSVPVKILITGKDAGRVVNFEGKAMRDFTADRGNLYLGLMGAVPSVVAPAEIKIVADAAGYIPSSLTVPLIQALNTPFTIRLVKESDPPAGVGVKTEAMPASTASGLTAPKQITVSAPATANAAPVQTTISFAQNTQLRDEKGNPVVTPVTARISSYSTQTPSALTGTALSANIVLAKDAEGKTNVKASLQPAGYLSVELIDPQGNKVASFSNPVTVSTTISPEFVHPITKQKVKAGDDLQVYVYDENTGVWSFEQMTKVEPQGGGLGVKFTVTHFSDRAIGWQALNRCDATYFTVTGLPAGQAFYYVYKGNFSDTDEYRYDGSIGADGSASIYFPGASKAPSGRSMSAEVFTASGFKAFEYKDELCAISAQLKLTPPAPGNTVTVEAEAKATCANGKKFEVTSPATIYFGKANTSPGTWPSTQFGSDGKGSFVGLEPNTDYEARLYYGADTFSQPFKTGTANSKLTFQYQIKGDVSFCN
ncbi:hypothetical protein [Runella slithyformis]|uniref:Uncharacterized protein n=1 Tax=Runella slithyformis (strain ATCC 29530 / DSM 19594 / LMG 11500 / NCIMB 11436 / LSU 4) TaxID=761193 RepID=A0A7U4E851_RUNSL|nr:hypothetical protein [Runella slithyformis]AEI50998.1 hypothetical protein Runsl_4679 [Runella slithyformis DSM 19594]